MSRGLGWLQQRLLEELNKSDRAQPLHALAGAVFAAERDELGNFMLTPSQRVSVHRALQKLAQAEVIYQLNRHYWGTPAHRLRWEENERPVREHREALRSLAVDMHKRYGLKVSAEDVSQIGERYGPE